MTDAAKQKILAKYWDTEVTCPGCGEEIRDSDDLSKVEYVRTKRKTDIFFHAECFGKIWRE
ncbi:hypothetical protein EDD59_11139 [Muricomes intestini]|jgi:hypothetical protein|uniref:Uncharacterized protein n=1 Tax=Muricomes intestini TaxID=1796634 RepID=A0A4R3K6I5_9FIRM|nr:hypothetical protein [Muricomes intestini]TCS78514.1 hypothetical protein EDD59_11139 [Muricomes intestini]